MVKDYRHEGMEECWLDNEVVTRKICWFCLVLINSVLLNLLCVWVSVDVKQHSTVVSQTFNLLSVRAQELCESRLRWSSRAGLPVPNSPYGLCGSKATSDCSISELRSCVKVEVAVLSSPSLTVLMVSVDVKQH